MLRIGLFLLVCLALISTAAPGATRDAPRVTTLSHYEDRVEGGAEVVATGVNFTADMTVTIGDAAVDDLVVESARQLRFRVPRQQAPGTRTLTVRSAAGIHQRQFWIHPKPLAELAPGEITTVGGGVYDVGDGEHRSFSYGILAPRQIAVDAARNVYVADARNHRIRRIDAVTGTINTVAGSGRFGFDGDGGPAVAAALNFPFAVAVDREGNLFIADTFNKRVRRVDAATGMIGTVIASEYPVDLAFDAAGSLYVSEAGASRVRRIEAVTGVVTTVAGRGDCYEHVPPSDDGGLATEACIDPRGICLDAAGNLFIADGYNKRVRRVDATTGVITTVAGRPPGRGNLEDEGPATEIEIDEPFDVAVTSDGTLYLADGHEGSGDYLSFGAVRRVDPVTGWMSLRHVEAEIGFTSGLALDDVENLYIADPDDGLVRVESSSSGLLAAFAGSGQTGPPGGAHEGSLATDRPLGSLIDVVEAGDSLYVMGGSFFGSYGVFRIDIASNRIATVPLVPGSQGLISGHALAVDRRGTVFTVDGDIFAPTFVRRFAAGSGKQRVLAGGGELPPEPGRKGTKVHLDFPGELESGSGGVLYAATFGAGVLELDARTGRILKRLSPRDVSSLAISPNGLYAGAGYDVLLLHGGQEDVVAGNGTPGYSGDGGPATLAGLDYVYDVAVDRAGNLFIMTGDRVRRVDAGTGIIETVAGGAAAGYTGDGGPATAAALDRPYRVATGESGVVFVVCASGVIRAFRPPVVE